MPVLTGSDIPADNAVAAYARDVVIGIGNLAARSLGGGKPPEVAANDAAAPPDDPLLDLTLPESLRGWLKPAADALGLTLKDDNARDAYGRFSRKVTYLTDNGDIRRTLLHMPPKMLTAPGAYPFLSAVMYVVEKNAFVAVFATELPAPAPVHANVIDALWKKERPMDSRFIPWAWVSELPKLDLVDQIEFMRRHLGLEMLTPRMQSGGAVGASAGTAEVTVKDIDRIVAILSRAAISTTRAAAVRC